MTTTPTRAPTQAEIQAVLRRLVMGECPCAFCEDARDLLARLDAPASGGEPVAPGATPPDADAQVERVAKAIAYEILLPSWDNIETGERDDMRRAARAAIAALGQRSEREKLGRIAEGMWVDAEKEIDTLKEAMKRAAQMLQTSEVGDELVTAAYHELTRALSGEPV